MMIDVYYFHKLCQDCIYARSKELTPANTKITDTNSKLGWLALVLPLEEPLEWTSSYCVFTFKWANIHCRL
jgi:hypothetical protein